jgi:hypothetical protein
MKKYFKEFSSKKLEGADTHLHDACAFLNQATISIVNLRNQYEEIVSSATDQCNIWAIPIQLTYSSSCLF